MSKCFLRNLGRCYTFRYDQCGEMLRCCTEDLVSIRGKYPGVYTYNIPCAFDIETTSFYDGEQKVGLMYHWQFGFNGCVVMGRTWEQFVSFTDDLVRLLSLDPKHRLVIGVHNLGFEFQFMRKWFEWHKVFANDERKPITAMTENGLDFHCTWLLSGYSLAKLGDQLTRYKYRKLSGDLDYSLARHGGTPMTGKETAYCICDVKVVMCYLMEEIEHNHNNINYVPITKTGYVRRYARNMCFYGTDHYVRDSVTFLKYRDGIKYLKLRPDEFLMQHDAFAGGFTHANPITVNRITHDVDSYDFTSSYPAAMLLPLYPMSGGERVKVESDGQLRELLAKYCCIFRIRFTNIEIKDFYECYISNSKCGVLRNAEIYNGRVARADLLETVITEQDFQIIRHMYNWESMAVAELWKYRRGYLPRNFIRAILKLYNDKTMLKGVKGKEAEYLISKGMLNSLYGMTVTNIMRDTVTYEYDWDSVTPDINEVIEKYNNDSNRFMFYPWGVYVTSVARKNLFTAITEFGHDYVYSDTDSVKVINADRHKTYIEGYNRQIIKKMEDCCRHYKLDPALVRPKTINGVEKPLGVWDYEGRYKRFKTLGAKRYLVEKDDGSYELTVSGLNKRIAGKYLEEKYGNDIFEAFNNNMNIPPEFTGKMTHTYIDDERKGVLTDYLGNTCSYSERSGIHLENAGYEGSSSKFFNFILKVKGDLIT